MRIAAVIVAAGAGTRMGGVAKALLEVGRQTFLARIVATAREVGLDDAIVVVAAPFGEEVAAHARALGARVEWNPEPARGMASSIAIGFAALHGGDAAWLWPVDHPYVDAGTLRALIGALGDHEVARPVHGGRRGHPPLIARRAWARLAACGASTARDAIAGCDVTDVPVPDPGVLRDIDTAADREAS